MDNRKPEAADLMVDRKPSAYHGNAPVSAKSHTSRSKRNLDKDTVAADMHEMIISNFNRNCTDALGTFHNLDEEKKVIRISKLKKLKKTIDNLDDQRRNNTHTKQIK